jgi:hypothetical protein
MVRSIAAGSWGAARAVIGAAMAATTKSTAMNLGPDRIRHSRAMHDNGAILNLRQLTKCEAVQGTGLSPINLNRLRAVSSKVSNASQSIGSATPCISWPLPPSHSSS